MIIWQGFGLLTIIVPFIVCILMEQIYAGAPIGLGLIIGGLIVYKLGIHLHDPKKNEVILFDEEGIPYKFSKHVDTLFFIKMEYVAILVIIFGIISLFKY